MTNEHMISRAVLAERPLVRKTLTVLDPPLPEAPTGMALALRQAFSPVLYKRRADLRPERLSEPPKFPFLHEREGKLELVVPYGYEQRSVNAVTFKALVGSPRDTLLRQQGSRWDIVSDEELIDLADTSVAYKVGPLQIYS